MREASCGGESEAILQVKRYCERQRFCERSDPAFSAPFASPVQLMRRMMQEMSKMAPEPTT